MRLISLYIENFGGLSGFSLDFAEGVTVVAEPNGFGKTTLAEFIRAMFYGFPRKTKALDKSRRQKYTPWNGGKCGGNLVFQFEDRRYRIERTFGATPKGDTFKLMDLETGRKSDRFSEEIGQELFQLDADSFERSTYMPQLSGSGSLSTNNIQAKLTRLVEDTGDINHFDKAMEVLRSKRSAFIPYRGSGGTVAEARNRISRLQQELDRAEEKREALHRCRESIRQTEGELQQCADALLAVRRDITAASEAAAAAALRREYEQLLGQKQEDQAELARIREAYPGGIPESGRINRAEEAARKLAVLEGRQVTTQSDLDAQTFVEHNRHRFEENTPDQTELEHRRQQHRSYEAIVTEARSIGLSEQEQAQYQALLPLFTAGKLDKRRIDRLSEDNRELERLRSALEHTAMDPAEEQELYRLEHFFAPGIPDAAQIEKCREDLKACQQLRQETAQLTASFPPVQPRKKANPFPLILALLAFTGAAAAGIVLLTQRQYLWGGIFLGIGILCLIAGVFLGLRMMVARELSGSSAQASPQLRHRIEANRSRIEQREAAAAGFTGRYCPMEDPAEALRKIEDRAEVYIQLNRRRESISAKRDQLKAAAEKLAGRLREELDCNPSDFGKAIMELYLNMGQFSDLQAEKQEADARREALLCRGEALRAELTRYLEAFYQDVTPDRFGQLLALLQRESEAYVRCCAQARTWADLRRTHEAELKACTEELDAFFQSCGQNRGADLHQQLQKLRIDCDTASRILARQETLNHRLEELRLAHGAILTAPQPEETGDIQSLKTQEQELADRQTLLTRELLAARQTRIQLRGEADRIPELQDELEEWNTRKAADQKNAAILDDTMDFLEKAKDSLSCSYLGPIREHFIEYLTRLSGMEQGQVLISPELEVQLERQGQARELAFFSAGQTDLVMLCMRLALVDALFGEKKPFIILDDPFVNLDDERTAQALKLLGELGKERQILYLVCNSSRMIQKGES